MNYEKSEGPGVTPVACGYNLFSAGLSTSVLVTLCIFWDNREHQLDVSIYFGSCWGHGPRFEDLKQHLKRAYKDEIAVTGLESGLWNRYVKYHGVKMHLTCRKVFFWNLCWWKTYIFQKQRGLLPRLCLNSVWSRKSFEKSKLPSSVCPRNRVMLYLQIHILLSNKVILRRRRCLLFTVPSSNNSVVDLTYISI